MHTRGALVATMAAMAVGSLVVTAKVVAECPIAAGQMIRYALAAVIMLALLSGRLPRLSLAS